MTFLAFTSQEILALNQHHCKTYCNYYKAVKGLAALGAGFTSLIPTTGVTSTCMEYT